MSKQNKLAAQSLLLGETINQYKSLIAEIGASPADAGEDSKELMANMTLALRDIERAKFHVDRAFHALTSDAAPQIGEDITPPPTAPGDVPVNYRFTRDYLAENPTWPGGVQFYNGESVTDLFLKYIGWHPVYMEAAGIIEVMPSEE